MAGREIASDPAVLVEGAHVVLGLVVLQPEVPLIVEAHGPHFGGVEQQRTSLQHSQSDSEELNSGQPVGVVAHDEGVGSLDRLP